MSEASETTSSRAGNGGTNFKQRITRDGKEKLESGKRTAADQIDDIAGAIGAAGSKLESQPTLANYVSQLATGVGSIATRLREDSIEDLYHEGRRLAVQHPALFVLGSAAVGLAIARFMKSEASASEGSQWPGESVSDPQPGGL